MMVSRPDVRAGYILMVVNLFLHPEATVTKLNISMPQELLDEIDAEAGELGLTRSGLIQEASARYIVTARQDRETERRRLEIEAAATRMREIGERLGLSGRDAVELVHEARAAREAGRG